MKLLTTENKKALLSLHTERSAIYNVQIAISCLQIGQFHQ